LDEEQLDLLSPASELGLVRSLLADLHDDLEGKIGRFRQLVDLSSTLGAAGTMFAGGEITFAAWTEARSSFVHGNFVATVMLCQSLAEHLLASYLSLGLNADEIPNRVAFKETLDRCLAKGILGKEDAADLRRLMELRNPLSHYRSIDDEHSLSRRVLETQQRAELHLFADASFAIGTAVQILSLPAFRLVR
jgi:hypothetical protein